ncbi:cation transporter [Lentibacillus sp. CBA3610]|uniref:cation transporter n=1 Tax=Lentibacillus sp. CBA3610 TaxID=2518176 RepID=UPI001595E5D6|nr:heavy metal-associated domain-containing protein [Lentibacillus sp. CBA3610]QKY69854.1 heavy-metal-associated domain-containing protein [Lentibacillus sp. CBA3610]
MIETVYLDVRGMHCVNCPAKVEKSLLKMEGIIEVNVSWELEKGSVTFDRNLVCISAIIERINKMGFEAKKAEEVQA